MTFRCVSEQYLVEYLQRCLKVKSDSLQPQEKLPSDAMHKNRPTQEQAKDFKEKQNISIFKYKEIFIPSGF